MDVDNTLYIEQYNPRTDHQTTRFCTAYLAFVRGKIFKAPICKT